jgi:hypothetical protein
MHQQEKEKKRKKRLITELQQKAITESVKQCRCRRKEDILNIIQKQPEGHIKRITTNLLQFLNSTNEQYLVIKEVLQPELIIKSYSEVKEIAGMKSKWQKVNFSDRSISKRFMAKLTKRHETPLLNVLKSFQIVFPHHVETKIKIIHSKQGDKAQLTHSDLPHHLCSKKPKNLLNYHYSAIIALCDNTKLLMGQERIEIRIPKGDMIFFRGDTLHAGAAYEKCNYRYFLSTYSEDFKPTKSVTLHK